MALNYIQSPRCPIWVVDGSGDLFLVRGGTTTYTQLKTAEFLLDIPSLGCMWVGILSLFRSKPSPLTIPLSIPP